MKDEQVDPALAEVTIDRAREEIGDLARETPARRWRMSIPADPRRDSDLLIAAGLDAGLRAVRELRVAREVVEAAPPPFLLRALADWLDLETQRRGWQGDQVQRDLHALADALAATGQPATADQPPGMQERVAEALPFVEGPEADMTAREYFGRPATADQPPGDSSNTDSEHGP